VCLVPLVGAIASGNCVLVKPSEMADESAKLMEKLVLKYLDTVSIYIDIEIIILLNVILL
jgi:aldehyde dehydrogenase (NAD+)